MNTGADTGADTGTDALTDRGEAGQNEIANPEPEQPDGSARKISWWAELRGLLLMLFVVLAFHSLLAKPFYIPSQSMMPNLLVGDRLIVSKYPYGWSWVSMPFHLLPRSSLRVAGRTPEYGDIVIAVPPDRREDYIKRVVALPGDHIALVNGQIILNGRAVPQEIEPALRIPADAGFSCEEYLYPRMKYRLVSGAYFCEIPTYRETLPNGATYLIFDHTHQPLDDMAEITIPAGHVFLMGDNRDHSADSRAELYERGLGGPVPLENIGGRAEFITFSLDGSQSFNPLRWVKALRRERSGRTLRPALANQEKGAAFGSE